MGSRYSPVQMSYVAPYHPWNEIQAFRVTYEILCDVLPTRIAVAPLTKFLPLWPPHCI